MNIGISNSEETRFILMISLKILKFAMIWQNKKGPAIEIVVRVYCVYLMLFQ